ncbi:hypothetical protein C8F04DRAFT_1181012 [Mycena alexandri]|uniref:Uncharacterized protein n=1 Tax=Mycena alexandri TaxID=1745969 RepID=A0AAD6X6Q8_9AGAR|nr:hypothetical protein C8F04DRAFT_1181012 [Mycena alexandri]
MSPVKPVKPPKEMFDLYDAADVPDIMPFPDLALVWTSKGQEIAVPKLNAHQRSWIHDVALRDAGFASLQGKERLAFYNKVKGDALKAKAFQHTPRPEDETEEARLPALIASWKKAQAEKKKKTTTKKSDKGKAKAGADDGGNVSDQGEDDGKGQAKGGADDGGNVSDQGEDQAARTGLLRGYRIAGWNRAIQKVISNKRTAAGDKAKKDIGGEDEAPALQKLLGLAKFTGRDKFRGDRHEEILDLAHSLPGVNIGGNFRRAEGILFAKEDKAVWDTTAASEEGVNWKERQSLVATGFQAMVSNLNASGQFRPFVAVMVTAWIDEHGEPQLDWVEAIPSSIRIPESFEKQNKRLVGNNLDAMYAWAAQPLKDLVATGSAQDTPTFPLSLEALDDTAPKALAHTVTTFLSESYEAAFGSLEKPLDIPWADVAQNAPKYYDNTHCPVVFTSSGLTELTRAQWDALATTLASTAGAGTFGFFRKAPAVPREEAGLEQEAEEEVCHKEEEARLEREQEAEARRKQVEEEAHRKEEEGHLEREQEAEGRRKQAEEARRKGEQEAEARHKQKRKAEAQLVPEGAGTGRRTSRKRLTPEEAKLERQQKLAAEVANGKKPGYEYVRKSPAKAKAARGSRKRCPQQNLSNTRTQVHGQDSSSAET